MKLLAPNRTAGTDIGSLDERRLKTETGKVLLKSPQDLVNNIRYNYLTNLSRDRYPEVALWQGFLRVGVTLGALRTIQRSILLKPASGAFGPGPFAAVPKTLVNTKAPGSNVPGPLVNAF